MVQKVLEKDIQRLICDWLATQPHILFWRTNNIPVFDKGRFRALPKYTPRGLPDILCFVNGKLHALEVKVPHYWKYTDDQILMKEKIENNGGVYKLVTSLEEAQKVFV